MFSTMVEPAAQGEVGSVGVGWVPGEADEDGESEEGVHIDDTVKGGDVDAGGHGD